MRACASARAPSARARACVSVTRRGSGCRVSSEGYKRQRRQSERRDDTMRRSQRTRTSSSEKRTRRPAPRACAPAARRQHAQRLLACAGTGGAGGGAAPPSGGVSVAAPAWRGQRNARSQLRSTLLRACGAGTGTQRVRASCRLLCASVAPACVSASVAHLAACAALRCCTHAMNAPLRLLLRRTAPPAARRHEVPPSYAAFASGQLREPVLGLVGPSDTSSGRSLGPTAAPRRRKGQDAAPWGSRPAGSRLTGRFTTTYEAAETASSLLPSRRVPRARWRARRSRCGSGRKARPRARTRPRPRSCPAL
jgi:hypothetical protein